MPHVLALIDCDCFYASCEQAFDPKLWRRPVIVLSNNDGCVVARSKEARQLGIRMGVPLFQIQELIDAHDVFVFSSNYALYGDASQRVVSVLQEFTPEVEIYSIDEAFMNLAAIHCASYQALGRTIQEKVYKEARVPVTIGIAETKTLAKVANFIAKKSVKAGGVLDLTKSPHQEIALARVPVEEVWGTGPSYTKLLQGAGIINALQLRDADTMWIRKHMSVFGARIVMELRGVSCLPLETCSRPRKSVTVSRSFPVVIETEDEVRQAVAVFVSRAAEKLRRDGLAAGVVTVFVETGKFAKGAHYANSATLELIYPTDNTQELVQSALEALGRIFRQGFEYRRAGVSLNELVPAGQLTHRLFDNETLERFRRVMPVMDRLNARYGPSTVRFAVARTGGRWQTKFARRSSRYTTCLEEVQVVT